MLEYQQYIAGQPELPGQLDLDAALVLRVESYLYLVTIVEDFEQITAHQLVDLNKHLIAAN